MTLRRLISLWIGVLGELLVITAEVIEPGDGHYLATEEVVDNFRKLVGL